MIIPKSGRGQAEEEQIHQDSGAALGQVIERPWRVQLWRFPRLSKTKPGLTDGCLEWMVGLDTSGDLFQPTVVWFQVDVL